MANQLNSDIHAVFLPAFADLALSPEVEAFLRRGCVAVLPGESRAEYVGRDMSADRQATETSTDFRNFVDAAKLAAGGPLLVAVDQEMAGIQRLHRLVPPLPTAKEASALSANEIESRTRVVAAAARQLGVNMFLSPIVDLVTGRNVWLDRRTISTDGEVVGRIASAFVAGAQAERVVCTAKHFPGFFDISADPAIDETAVVSGSVQDLEAGYGPFHEVISAGVKAVMVGPAPVAALDRSNSASTSPAVIGMLRRQFAFDGVVVSDDLDSPAVMLGKTVAHRAVDALNAGCDLLLVAAGSHLPDLAGFVGDAVKAGILKAERVAEAANRVRALAKWAS
ncbi:glycoside hydrolase family 3 N-terminal domain-containing protein [Devosia sp.]|uniref:glycoside hydrolase family 3 N-terminal domain-containing protein n=1 Tax=Devosia sp. TaxID=1871048 RepID=UPI0037C0D0EB